MGDTWVAVLATLGVIFTLLAGIGSIRMPDFYMRTSISTKAVTLGVGLTLVAAGIAFNDFGVTSRIIATIVFIILTAPVGAHVLGRAAYFAHVKLWDKSVINELSGKYERSTHTLNSFDEEHTMNQDKLNDEEQSVDLNEQT